MLGSLRAFAAEFEDKFSDDMRLTRKEAKTDSVGYQIGEGATKSLFFRGRIINVIERVGFNGATKITGLRLKVPTSCNFSDFCVGDIINPLCGPHSGQCFSVTGGNGSAGARLDGSGSFLEIDIVQS